MLANKQNPADHLNDGQPLLLTSVFDLEEVCLDASLLSE